MVLLAVIAVIVLPVLEVLVFVQVVHAVGVLLALLLLFGVSFLGARMVKRQGLSTLQRARLQLANSEVPGAAVLDGLLILTAGLLLVVPGFVTDAIGLALLVPVVRRVARGAAGLLFARRLEARMLRRW